MGKISLNDVKWKEFKIEDLFNISLSKGDNQANLLLDGNIPLISSGTTNNGICKFIKTGDEKSNIFNKNLITVDMFGKCYYHNYDFYSVSHGRINILFPKFILNEFIANFFIVVMENAFKNIFSYNRMCSQKRLIKMKIMLPIDEQENPNLKFMEDYIKQETKIQTQKIISYYENKLNDILSDFDLEKLKAVKYKNKKYKIFNFNNIFKEIKRGKRLTKNNQFSGNIPYISSTSLNNGVDNFISNDYNIRKFNNSLTIANSGSVGSCFYHRYEYIASDHVTALILENKNENIHLFMSSIIKKIEEKYSFNREIKDERIKKEKIILPVKDDDETQIDWEYMSNFVANIEKEKIETVLRYIYIYIYI